MADEQKKTSKLKWILLIILLLLIGGGAAGAWFLFLQDKFMHAGESGQKVEKVETRATRPVGSTVSLPVFTVNLADPLGQRFIKINLDVEVADSKVLSEITQQNARIRDSLILLLSSKSYADVATTENKLMLKSEITDRLNTILGPGKIYQVFITDMVIQ
ncbi:MAG: flagellar basal body-associated FliL family protein [Desulfovibrio sp.]|nr:flagellar basal body-associated FliL family protein [Desulfovibrio sp.]